MSRFLIRILQLGATGTITGLFVKQDSGTPVFGAQVAIGNLGFAATDTNGLFVFEGVPVGSHTILERRSDTCVSAIGNTTISYNGQTQNVQLVEATLGTVNGSVLDSYRNSFVAGAQVQISFSDGLTPTRTVTTGPSGSFSFPGSPLGQFNLNATYDVPGAVKLTVMGQARGTLASATANVTIQLQPLTGLTVHVVRNDGFTPATNTRVTVGALQQDTSASGDAQFSNLPVPGNYAVTAISRTGGDFFNGAQAAVTLTGNATNLVVTLKLPGIGYLDGTVLGSDGTTREQCRGAVHKPGATFWRSIVHSFNGSARALRFRRSAARTFHHHGRESCFIRL